MTADKHPDRRHDREAELFVRLQKGLPLVPRPFAAIGRGMGMTEPEVLKTVRRLERGEKIRRFGGIFDSASLGCRTLLCAVRADGKALKRIGEAFQALDSVTHCYLRKPLASQQQSPSSWPSPPRGEGRELIPNLWFTVTARANLQGKELRRIRRIVQPHALMEFPAVRVFKIAAIFDPRLARHPDPGRLPEPVPGQSVGIVRDKGRAFTRRERELARRLQANLDLRADVFGRLARVAGFTEPELIAVLRAWKARGVLRRIGLIARHRQAGFKVNGMCVWNVPESRLGRAGSLVAAFPETTHCYYRLPHKEFCYTLYAMIHAGSVAAAKRIHARISRRAGLSNGQVLVSVREFKKTSPVYFAEE